MELFDNCLHYVINFIAEEPKDEDDLTLGVIEKQCASDIWVTKYNISGIEKTISENMKWLVIIYTAGAEDIEIYFKTEKAAKILLDRLIKWRYGK